jgi:hypothetical protein
MLVRIAFRSALAALLALALAGCIPIGFRGSSLSIDAVDVAARIAGPR